MSHMHTAVLIGRELVIAGGATADVRTAQFVKVFNVDTGQWKTLPPTSQYISEATVNDNNLVLVGRFNSTNREITKLVST